MSAARAAVVRKRAFRAADGFVVEAWKACRKLAGDDAGVLGRTIRERISRSGAALVAASAAEPDGATEDRRLREVRDGLLETRYLLYLARRLGSLDLGAYRRLIAMHDAAERDLRAWADGRESAAGSRTPPERGRDRSTSIPLGGRGLASPSSRGGRD